jgi:hypothetical protein
VDNSMPVAPQDHNDLVDVANLLSQLTVGVRFIPNSDVLFCCEQNEAIPITEVELPPSFPDGTKLVLANVYGQWARGSDEEVNRIEFDIWTEQNERLVLGMFLKSFLYDLSGGYDTEEQGNNVVIPFVDPQDGRKFKVTYGPDFSNPNSTRRATITSLGYWK